MVRVPVKRRWVGEEELGTAGKYPKETYVSLSHPTSDRLKPVHLCLGLAFAATTVNVERWTMGSSVEMSKEDHNGTLMAIMAVGKVAFSHSCHEFERNTKHRDCH